MLLGVDVSTTTVAEWIEEFFKRTDIVTQAAWRPFLRFTAGRAGSGIFYQRSG